MASRKLRRLAVSVATGRVAAVFLEDDKLLGWCRSAQAFCDAEKTTHIVGGWIKGFEPDQMILEDEAGVARKGMQSRATTEVIAQLFAEAPGSDLRVRRTQTHDNKYQEAAALAKQFPEALPILPKRPPIWLPEPRNLSYFEALALANSVMAPKDSEA